MYIEDTFYLFYLGVIGFLVGIVTDIVDKRFRRAIFELGRLNSIFILAFFVANDFTASSWILGDYRTTVYEYSLMLAGPLSLSVSIGYYFGSLEPFKNTFTVASFMQHHVLPGYVLLQFIQYADEVTVEYGLILGAVIVFHYLCQHIYRMIYKDNLYTNVNIRTVKGNLKFLAAMLPSVALLGFMYFWQGRSRQMPDWVGYALLGSWGFFFFLMVAVGEIRSRRQQKKAMQQSRKFKKIDDGNEEDENSPLAPSPPPPNNGESEESTCDSIKELLALPLIMYACLTCDVKDCSCCSNGHE